MESLFFVMCGSALGYIIHNQEKLKQDIFDLREEIARIEMRLPKRKTDNEL
ncbi:MAG: hypothetical protein LW635_09700 [Microcystis sp. 53598_E5]|jgi:hypothetical protein|nr:hypothetical protein [Microcystis sp. 53598_E5]MCE2673860.1 hypothetical protein [Microcystis sp. 53598_E5]